MWEKETERAIYGKADKAVEKIRASTSQTEKHFKTFKIQILPLCLSITTFPLTFQHDIIFY
ncbi:MAG: hypothetical protein D3925_14255 [Candidatus Electrothrix sp. AR5]|nr:hypothetical protein [Candidatus Electrothrix sp. AR5]